MIDKGSKNLRELFKNSSYLGGLAVIIIGASVIFGYIFESQSLKSVFPGIVAMNPATAIAFILSGIAIYFLSYKEKIDAWLFRIGLVCAGFVALIGFIKIYGLVFGSDILYIDRHFFSDQLQMEGIITGRPNQMAPNTALNFLLAGMAIILLYFDKRIKLANSLSLAVYLIALLPIFGYFYGVRNFVGLADYIPMALNTAGAFIVLSISMLNARPNSGFMPLVISEGAGGIIMRRLIPAAILTPFILGYLNMLSLRMGIISGELSLSLFAIENVIVLFILIYWMAVRLWGLDLQRQIISEKLYEEKKKLEILMESIGDGVVVINRAWNITLWNKSAAMLTGYTKEDALGKAFRSIIKFVRESDRKENIEFIERAMVLGKVHFMENHTLLIKRDGHEIPIGDSAAPIIDKNGQITGAVIIFRDATKEQEDNRMSSDFTYASHQFRTPVTKALWAMEIALGENDTNKLRRENLSAAYLAIKSVNELGGHLLDISDIDQKRIIKTIEDIKLEQLLSLVFKDIKESIKAKNIILTVKFGSEMPIVKTDPALLKKSLSEILKNAIDYSNAGSAVNVDVALHDGGVMIKIQDFGIGIPDDQKHLIFTKFFRGKNLPEDSVGAGLGLYIAREYISILNGRIWFESQVGSGTTFLIFLPISK